MLTKVHWIKLFTAKPLMKDVIINSRINVIGCNILQFFVIAAFPNYISLFISVLIFAFLIDSIMFRVIDRCSDIMLIYVNPNKPITDTKESQDRYAS